MPVILSVQAFHMILNWRMINDAPASTACASNMIGTSQFDSGTLYKQMLANAHHFFLLLLLFPFLDLCVAVLFLVLPRLALHLTSGLLCSLLLVCGQLQVADLQSQQPHGYSKRAKSIRSCGSVGNHSREIPRWLVKSPASHCCILSHATRYYKVPHYFVMHLADALVVL